jgi:hypothetical protein
MPRRRCSPRSRAGLPFQRSRARTNGREPGPIPRDYPITNSLPGANAGKKNTRSPEAMEQAGHTRSTMTSEYTIIALARREQAVRRVQERLFGDQERKGPKVVSLKVVRDETGVKRA